MAMGIMRIKSDFNRSSKANVIVFEKQTSRRKVCVSFHGETVMETRSNRQGGTDKCARVHRLIHGGVREFRDAGCSDASGRGCLRFLVVY